MGRDIKAGSAYVEMSLQDDKLDKGLARSKDRLKDWGSAAASIGAGFLDAGNDVSTFINKSVEGFADFGTKFSGIGRKSSKDLKQLKKDLAELDVTPSGEAITAAKNLDSEMKKATNSASALSFEIGSILSNEVSGATGFVTKLTVATTKWLQANHDTAGGLVKVVAGTAAVAVGVGTAATALGQAGHVIFGIGHAVGAVGGLLGVLVSPVVLVTAALVAGAYAWTKYTESGRSAAADIRVVMADIFDVVKGTIGGISDAVSAGDLALAGKIAFAGLKIASLEGILGITSEVGGVWRDFIGKLATQIVTGDFREAWNTSVLGMAATWDAFANGVVSVFTKAAKAVARIWKETTTDISNWLLKDAVDRGLIGATALIGLKASAEDRRRKGLNQSEIDITQKQLEEHADLMFDAQLNGGKSTDKAGRETTAEDEARIVEELTAKLERLGSNPGSFLDDAQKAAGEQIGGTEKAIQSALDAYQATARDNAEKSEAALAPHVSNGLNEANSALDKLIAEFNQLRNQAAAEADAARNAQGAGTSNASKEIFGSFSAAALQAAGGGSPIERVAKAAEAHLAVAQKQKAAVDDLAKIDGDLLTEVRMGAAFTA